MGYIEKNIMRGERVLARGRVSGAAYVGLITLLLLGFAASLLIVGIFLVVYVILEMMRLSSVEMAVTDRRIIGKTGVFSTNSIDLKLSQLEGVAVSKSLMGGLLGYGSLVITGTGQARMVFPGIARPEKLRRVCMEASHGAGLQPAPSTFSPPPSSVPVAESGEKALFEVQIVDRVSGEESWVRVRAVNQEEAVRRAVATGAMVGKSRLIGIE